MEIPITRTGKIKTKKSDGNNALIGAAVGGRILGIMGASAPDSSSYVSPSNPQVGFVFGSAVGILLGALIGGLTAIFKNSETYSINGDFKNEKVFKDLVTGLESRN